MPTSTTTEFTTDGSTADNYNLSSTTSSHSTSLITTATSASDDSITTVHSTPGHRMNAGTGVGVAIAVILIFVVCALIFYYLRKTGRLKCLTARVWGRPRRSSTSSSRRALEPEDNESVDNMPRVTEGDMFAITEPDDAEREAPGDDGYFYDEVFGSSAFEDETTNVSNKELFSVSSDPDVPDLLLRVDNINLT